MPGYLAMTALESLIAQIEAMLADGCVFGDSYVTTVYRIEKVRDAMEVLTSPPAGVGE